MSKGIGQYDLEYSNCSCFWGNEPGKFVKYIPAYLESGNVLDLGAGEGKNSIYLAEKGYKVVSVEISEFAINNFKKELYKHTEETQEKIEIIRANVIEYENPSEFEIVIAYGLLHCLYNLSYIDLLIEKIKKWVMHNGYVIIVSFNDKIKIPEVQEYLEPTLLPNNYLKKKFEEWDIINYEDDIITETHPTSKIEHQHSLSRILAKKI